MSGEDKGEGLSISVERESLLQELWPFTLLGHVLLVLLEPLMDVESIFLFPACLESTAP